MTGVSMTVPQSTRFEATIDGVVRTMPPQCHSVLITLLMRRGCLVSVGELIEELWPNPDREGEWAEFHVRVLISKLRSLGVDVVTCGQRSWMIERPGREMLGEFPLYGVGRLKRAA